MKISIPFLNRKTLFALLLLLVFLISLSLYIIKKPDYRIVLFYPKDDLVQLEGELRNIPRNYNKEERMELIVKELLLHPVSVYLNPIVPEGVKVNFSIFDKEKQSFHVDLSSEIVIIDRAEGRYPDDSAMLSIIEQNIRYHFPNLKEIYITVDSHVPFQPLYTVD